MGDAAEKIQTPKLEVATPPPSGPQGIFNFWVDYFLIITFSIKVTTKLDLRICSSMRLFTSPPIRCSKIGLTELAYLLSGSYL